MSNNKYTSLALAQARLDHYHLLERLLSQTVPWNDSAISKKVDP